MKKLILFALIAGGCAHTQPAGWAEEVEVKPRVAAVMILHVRNGEWDKELHDRTCPGEPVASHQTDCGAIFGCPTVEDYRCRGYPGKWAMDDAGRRMEGICQSRKWEIVRWRLTDTGGTVLTSWGESNSVSNYLPNKETEVSFECR